MTNKNIIEMYKKGYPVKFIAKRYQEYLYANYKIYHTVNYQFGNKKEYSYLECLTYVQDLIIKYLSGYFD